MKKYANILILIAGILWGFAGIQVKVLQTFGLSTIQISALRWLVSGPVMFIMVFLYDKNLTKIHIRDIGWFIITGILCILLSATLYFATMPLSTVAIANILMYTSPIWVMVFSIIFLKERLTPKKLLVLLLTFLGCIFIAGVLNPGNLAVTPLGIVTGLLSGLFYGLYSIFGKFVLKKYDSVTVTLYTMLFASIGALSIINFPQNINLILKEPSALIPLAVLIVFVTIFPYTLYTLGLKHTSATKASIISCIEPMTSAIAGTLILCEPFTLSQFFGIIMILTSIILLQSKK